jgi:putative membrane protein
VCRSFRRFILHAWAAGACALISPCALAHQAGADESTLIDVSVLVLLALLALAYARGSWLLSRRTPPRTERHRRAAYFWMGWASLLIALAPPLEPWTAHSFAAHMIQHELMMLVAAPLLVMSKPFGVVLWGLPAAAAHALGRAVQLHTLRSLARGLSAPVVAWLVHAVVLWGWHVPIAFEAALARPSVHWIQHTSFFIAAALFWWSVCAGGPHSERRGVAIVSVFTTAVHTSALGALFTFSSRLWYPTYASAISPWGLTPLEDQQLGGLVMWVPGGAVFLIVGLALTGLWLEQSGKRVSAL